MQLTTYGIKPEAPEVRTQVGSDALEENNWSRWFLPGSARPISGEAHLPTHQLCLWWWCRGAHQSPRGSFSAVRENLLLALHISVTPGPHTPCSSDGGRNPSPRSSILILPSSLTLDISQSLATLRSPTKKEFTLVLSASTSPLPDPPPGTYKHTSFKIKVTLLVHGDAHYLGP